LWGESLAHKTLGGAEDHQRPSGGLCERGVVKTGQVSQGKIVGIWAAAALPTAFLGWIIHPLVSPCYETEPLGSAVTRVVLLALGLMWEFVLVLIIVRQEERSLGWETLKRRLRLQAPTDPATGERRGRLWLWLVPALRGGRGVGGDLRRIAKGGRCLICLDAVPMSFSSAN